MLFIDAHCFLCADEQSSSAYGWDCVCVASSSNHSHTNRHWESPSTVHYSSFARRNDRGFGDAMHTLSTRIPLYGAVHDNLDIMTSARRIRQHFSSGRTTQKKLIAKKWGNWGEMVKKKNAVCVRCTGCCDGNFGVNRWWICAVNIDR